VGRVDRVHRQLTKRIDTLREAKGLSVNYLADFAGVSRGHMSKILSGKQSPTVRTLAKISQALDVDIAALFER